MLGFEWDVDDVLTTDKICRNWTCAQILMDEFSIDVQLHMNIFYSDLMGQEIENTSKRIRSNTMDTISDFW